ncbi:phage tail protein [Pantoea stewartii]|uniref:phage tail protein n=1 Tax=Pantoea stewartii TaxID=66269 RepID=UPI0013904516|nr:phage tail protein [Pantoea stewartii]
MTAAYYSILTNRGKELDAAATVEGKPVIIQDFVIGDGNGQAVIPDPARSSLVNEVFRDKIASLTISPEQATQIIAQLVLPADKGGFVVREVGLLTDAGELYAVANCAAIEKPASGVSVHLQFRLVVSDSSNVELKVASGDGLFLRIDQNLADLSDISAARSNLALGTAAVADVQTSKNDITPGRLLVNGGAIAVSSVVASGAEGSDYTDANDLPANAVSFVYASANNSPGFEGSVLDYAGHTGNYHVQISAKYQTGDRIKFRAMNGDNQTWNDWHELYHTGNKPTARDINAVQAGGGECMAAQGENRLILGWTGSELCGQVDDSPLGAMFCEANPPTPAQVGAYPVSGGNLNENASVTAISNYTDASAGDTLYTPGFRACLKGRGGDMDFADGASFYMRLVEEVGTQAYGELLWDGFSTVKSFRFFQNGTFEAPGNIQAVGALFESGGQVRVYSPNNPPPQPDLGPYATNDYVNSLRDAGGYGWFRSTTTGKIIQGFTSHASSGQRVQRVNFPIPFPWEVYSVVIGWAGTGSQMDYPARITGWDLSGVDYVADGGGIVSFYAIGG